MRGRKMERLFKGYTIQIEDNLDSTYRVNVYAPVSKENKNLILLEWYIDQGSRDIMQAMHKAKVSLRKALNDEKE